MHPMKNVNTIENQEKKEAPERERSELLRRLQDC